MGDTSDMIQVTVDINGSLQITVFVYEVGFTI